MPLSIAGRGFDDEARVRQTYAKLRYASDALGRCANSQLDLLRLETLSQHGGPHGRGDAANSKCTHPPL